MIDAAGAIYVIGGEGDTNFNDVWVSTDGGTRPDSVAPGGTGWVLREYSKGTRGEFRGYVRLFGEHSGVLMGTQVLKEDSRGTREVVGYLESTQGVHERCSRGTLGVLWVVSIACYAILRLLKRDSRGHERWGASVCSRGVLRRLWGILWGTHRSTLARALTRLLSLEQATYISACVQALVRT